MCQVCGSIASGAHSINAPSFSRQNLGGSLRTKENDSFSVLVYVTCIRVDDRETEAIFQL